MTRPTPREMRALEDAASPEIAAGCREVEALSFAERREIVATLRWIKAKADPTEADLARDWTAADPPADEPAGEDEPC